MSALPPIADMCSAIAHVCFVPIADIDRRLGNVCLVPSGTFLILCSGYIFPVRFAIQKPPLR